MMLNKFIYMGVIINVKKIKNKKINYLVHGTPMMGGMPAAEWEARVLGRRVPPGRRVSRTGR